MGVRFKFNLKEPQNEESLLMVICRWDNQPIKLSTRQRVFVATCRYGDCRSHGILHSGSIHLTLKSSIQYAL